MHYEFGEDTLRFFCGASSDGFVLEVEDSDFFFFTTTPFRPAFFFTDGIAGLALAVDGPGTMVGAATIVGGGSSPRALRAAIALQIS